MQEENDLGKTETGKDVRQALQDFLDQCRPAPTGKGTSRTKDRPTYPEWRDLVD